MNRQDIINKREWRELFEALPVVQGFFGGDPDSHGINELLRNIGVYMEELLAHADDGKPFVWYNLGFNSELIWALEGVHPITIELLGALHSTICNNQNALDFIDAAQTVGIPADCCSADKLATASLLRGLYPPPACTVGINTPCDSQVMGTQVMAETRPGAVLCHRRSLLPR